MAQLSNSGGTGPRHDYSGRWDLLAVLRVGNLAELAEVLERTRPSEGGGTTETRIQLRTHNVK